MAPKPQGNGRTGKSKPKVKGTSRASEPRKSAKSPPKAGTRARPGASEAKPVQFLSGGNPQIAKAGGDGPMQAYIAAMPGWKRDVGRWLDALIARNVPDVRKAVRWNSPFYGIEGWLLSFRVFTHYVKVTFPLGARDRPGRTLAKVAHVELLATARDCREDETSTIGREGQHRTARSIERHTRVAA